MSLPLLRALLLLSPLASVACVETGVHEQTVQKLEETRRVLAQKDTEIRAYQWQAATLTQQLHEGQERGDARERELFARLQQLTAANAALTEHLKKMEGERAALALAIPTDPAAPGRDGKPGVRPEDLRRMIAAADARNAVIVEELGRIQRLLAAGGAARPPLPFPADGAPARPHGNGGSDVRDPWGFGSRK